jgi:hypothetical protein
MAIKRTHFLKHEEHLLAACGSARRTEKGQRGFTTNPEIVSCTRCRQTMAFIEAVGHVDPAPTHTPIAASVTDETLVSELSEIVVEDTYSLVWRVSGRDMTLRGLHQDEFTELLPMLLDRGYTVRVTKDF